MNDYSGVITRFIECSSQKKPMIIYGDGSQTRDFVHVNDVVTGVVACVNNSKINGEIFNIGSGNPTSVNALADTVLSLTGLDLDVYHEKPREGDIHNSYADISKANKLLNYIPRVSLKTGIQTLLKSCTA